MKKTLFLTSLLVLGLVLSQVLPNLFGTFPSWLNFSRYFLTMSLLAFIMIEVGKEFEVDLKNKAQYAMDYLVAATAAAFPWIFVSLYFYFFLLPEETARYPAWIEVLLVGRFAAPTSAGVLFSMLAAAGLAGTWAYNKTRILAIFDDLDTVLLMIPLQILIVGFAWQLGGIVVAVFLMLYFGLKYYKKISLPNSWPWVLFYSFAMVGVSELLYAFTKDPTTSVGLHIEILLPAFLLGCVMRHPPAGVENHESVPIGEERAALSVSCAFMFLVGFSMPVAFGPQAQIESTMTPQLLLFHVLIVTLLANLGKMFVCFCYRSEATLRERLAVAVAMFPRGEVGAGVLAISLGYGISGPFVTVGFMSLALNLILTGGFIVVVKKLLKNAS